MNDRFKFRCMTLGGEWVYGNLAIINKKIKSCGMTVDAGFYISNEVGMPFAYPVRPETIGQCTGLKDKNGKLIYENDLIKCPTGIYRIAVDDLGLWTAIYKNNPFEDVCEWSDMVKEYAFNQNNVEIEILGNIHENADLLGEK